MLIKSPPRVPRRCSTRARTSVTQDVMTAGSLKWPIATNVVLWAMTMPLFCRPIKVRNSPIPTVIACRRLDGMASLRMRYNEVNATAANSTPVTDTTASASLQSSFMECTSV
ncbi:hypothetical protein D3C71_1794900 [compost metagenome]